MGDGSQGESGDAGSSAADDGDASADPGDVVQRYFAAISAQDYQQAWDLGGKNIESSYDAFVAGLETTERDDATVVGVDGETVSVDLVAQQTDGSAKEFTGTYTVRDGVIVAADVAEVGGGTDPGGDACGAPPNPFGYTFCGGQQINEPAVDFCAYFDCIANFDKGQGYVEQCQDETFSRSGGRPGVCSDHGGAKRELYEAG